MPLTLMPVGRRGLRGKGEEEAGDKREGGFKGIPTPGAYVTISL